MAPPTMDVDPVIAAACTLVVAFTVTPVMAPAEAMEDVPVIIGACKLDAAFTVKPVMAPKDAMEDVPVITLADIDDPVIATA